MASHGYVQLFLFGLLCIGAASAESSTCTLPRGPSGLDINKVYGDWFVGHIHGPANYTVDKHRCLGSSIKKINETALQIELDVTASNTLTIENSENPGAWHDLDEDSGVQVIYLSADGSAMELAFCIKNQTAPGLLLLSKQLPLSSGIRAEIVHAEETAGVGENINFFTWDSEATCPSP
ncbi:uncharacterized protein [Anabrus simplex]|uniref:uncharacterized protein n=1 Tax=Anabrus simplex TaxID=316456 RepID=UPI0035A3B9AF